MEAVMISLAIGVCFFLLLYSIANDINRYIDDRRNKSE